MTAHPPDTLLSVSYVERREGAQFDQAWDKALDAMLLHTPTWQRQEWRDAIEATRDHWHDAYEKRGERLMAGLEAPGDIPPRRLHFLVSGTDHVSPSNKELHMPATQTPKPTSKPVEFTPSKSSGKKADAVRKIVAAYKKSDKPLIFNDVCSKVGAKYPQDVEAAMFALEAIGKSSASRCAGLGAQGDGVPLGRVRHTQHHAAPRAATTREAGPLRHRDPPFSCLYRLATRPEPARVG